ncbi:Phloem protein 2-like protein [Artemisia annua]|uniref:Phloem protein 2-like protein n=1 Tax=Artemisia annua TaxID=35608 RepID=A0A2U1NRY0_ARTAN|nr:Phloem protein 2-like protein [Artemisia annua]
MKEILEYPRRKSTVAIKSIDSGYGQTEEQLQTLLYLSHENLVKLVGFCDEDDERIYVVYEYASNGSLYEYIHRQHINYQKYYSTNPTCLRNIFPWVIRLQFCLDAARGLNFLHDGSGKNDTIIHGNIKSSSILICRDGVGMIGDFGLSTNQYSDTHRLTKEYDVYSFGLVLFEVLSGVFTPSKISEDDPKFLPGKVKRGFNQGDLNDIIDPMLKKEFDTYHASLIGDRSAESLNIFVNIACRCFHDEEDPPTMADIVKELEKAYRIHAENLKHLKVPFTEIYSATKGFDDCMIGWGGFGGVYKAELFHVDVRNYIGMKESLVELYGYSRRKGKVALKRREIMSGQGRDEFWKEIDVLSGLNHQNIISLVGFCYEYGEMIIIYDYAFNGSFDGYFRNNPKLKWEQRLQICIDAAQGLNYLHNHHIIHRDVKSGNILLGDSLKGIIGDVGLSITINSADSQRKVSAAGTPGYIDPKYYNTGILSKQSDMYSFGVVLLEVLCGEFVRSLAEDKIRALLVKKAEQHLTSNQPSQIICGYLRKDLKNGKFLDSVKTFAAITHECLHSTDGDETHRLTMADVLKGLKKALTVHSIGSEPFSLEDIKSATNHFSKERVIGSGASGKIYNGELAFSKKSRPVAVKRLDRARSYEEGAFLKEVVKLSRYVHENIITLRGFCEEDDEKIIIMDHASNESLDRHLDKSILTWGIRLKISIGAAKGLNHIHSFEEDQKTVHGDIKSSNILLDHDWKACISDFIVSKSHGTLGYRDPEYSSSGATKETDVYSFGVVLFELLSGRRAIDKVEKYSHPTLRQIIDAGYGVKDRKDAGDGVKDEKDAVDGAKDKKDAGDGVKDEKDAVDGVKDEKDAGDGVKDKKSVFLTWMAARCFEENKVEALIFDDIKEQTDAKSIDMLSQAAYKCLQKDKKKRPTMALVIQELEKALNIHVDWEFEQKLPKDNENIMKMIEHRESQEITKKDLYPIFSSGIRPNNGHVWLSLNKDGKAKEMISATMFSYEKCWSSKLKVLENSRFGTVAKILDTSNLKIHIKIKTQFLSLGIIYGAYLVFKFSDTTTVSSEPYVKLEYSIASEDLNSYLAVRRDDGWMMIELHRFRNIHNQITEFKVQLERFWGHHCGIGPIFVDGIEFRPIDNVEHEESVDRSINADSSINWDQQSLSDFQEILKRSENDVPTTTKEELHELLSTGVLIDNGEKFFSLSKADCKKCHMLPAKAVINKSPDAKFTKCPSSTMSRFEEVVELQHHQAFSINCNIETKLLSPDTAYACYLVFQLPENSEGLKCPVKARDLLNKNSKESTIIYLKAPVPVDLYRDKRVPENREDGWMEVRVWKFDYNNKTKDNYIPMELKLACLGGTMLGLTVCGIEFRPL